jgi:hypothetical protein
MAIVEDEFEKEIIAAGADLDTPDVQPMVISPPPIANAPATPNEPAPAPAAPAPAAAGRT